MMRPVQGPFVRWAARKVYMRFLRYFALAIGILLVPAVASHAQVSVGIGVGGYAPGYAYGPPACTYGYYDYAPYACAPYGYYGPSWFNGGLFIGAGPWFRGGYGYGRGYGYAGYGRGYGGYGRGGYASYGRGGYGGGGYARGSYRGGGGSGYRGGGGGGGFHGGGGGSHGGGGGGRR